MRKDVRLELVSDDRDFNKISLFPDPKRRFYQQHRLTSQQERLHRLEYLNDFRQNRPQQEEWKDANDGEEESVMWIKEYQAAFRERLTGEANKRIIPRLLKFMSFFGKLTH